MPAWRIVYRDTFDRDDPPTAEGGGEDLVVGLATLWRVTLHSGIQAETGSATFSSFSLSLADGSVYLPAYSTEKNPTLAKLRAWAFPPLPPGTPPAPDAWKDACDTAPHGEDPEVLSALGRLHLALAGETSAKSLAGASQLVLQRAEALADKAELIALARL